MTCSTIEIGPKNGVSILHFRGWLNVFLHLGLAFFAFELTLPSNLPPFLLFIATRVPQSRDERMQGKVSSKACPNAKMHLTSLESDK